MGIFKMIKEICWLICLFSTILNGVTSQSIESKPESSTQSQIDETGTFNSNNDKNDIFHNEELISGFIHVGQPNGEMFYIWTPYNNTSTSELDERDIPLAIWLTGGPGCSSAAALFLENGPIGISMKTGELFANEYSWSKAMHVVYVDQPLGTGFSIVGNWLNYATDEKKISELLREFIMKFIDRYPSMKNRPLYLTGESFAGHFIPSLASYLIAFPLEGTKLTGVALGNAFVNPRMQYDSITEFAIQNGLINNENRSEFYQLIEICKKLIDNRLRPVAVMECNLALSQILGDKNPYDITKLCDSPPVCYNFKYLELFLNKPEVQARLGVNDPWEFCSKAVTFFLIDDWVTGVEDKVAQILDSGVAVTVYSGDRDLLCNWMGGLAWTSALQWKHADQFAAAPTTVWEVDGKASGDIKSYDNLTFIRVYDAGHMVPMDKPKEALAIIKSLINGKQTATSTDYYNVVKSEIEEEMTYLEVVK